jgi:uncharacterized membrane protein
VKFEHSVVINQPVEIVFAYVANLENLKQWQSGLIESKPVTSGPTGVGSKVAVVRQLLSQRLDGVAEVVAFEPNRVVSVRVTAGPMSVTASNTFEALGNTTRLTSVGELDIEGLLKIAGFLAAGGVKKQMEENLETLKKILEA